MAYKLKNKCDKFIVEYPPFTAEKQIKLIKFLMENYSWCLNVINVNNFENSLAASLNNLWNSLTSEEKQQIKEILNEK